MFGQNWSMGNVLDIADRATAKLLGYLVCGCGEYWWRIPDGEYMFHCVDCRKLRPASERGVQPMRAVGVDASASAPRFAQTYLLRWK